MSEAEFDPVSQEYADLMNANLALVGGDHSYYARRKIEVLARCSRSAYRSILDFGCGVGRLLPHLRARYGTAEISCHDESAASVALAKDGNPWVHPLAPGEFAAATGRFDLIIAACVFHHIPPAVRPAVIRDLAKALVPGGMVAIFEHNPWNPLTRRMVATCPFDRNAVLLDWWGTRRLFTANGFTTVAACHYLMFPAPLRWLRWLERPFGSLPLGGQHFGLFQRSD
jgi:SAM-dependent methyltransferase